MYAHILIATDGSDVAKRAVDHGLQLAKLAGSKVTIVTVTEPTTLIGAGYASVGGTAFDLLPEFIEAQEQQARNVLDDARKAADAVGIKAETILVDNSFAAEGVVATAEKEGVDLIVMGSHGRRGVSRLLLGSQTSNVLTHTKIPVLVTR